MRYYWLILLLLLIRSPVQALTAGTDSLMVTDSIAPDGFPDGNAARVAALSDNSTATYIKITGADDADTAGVGIQNTSMEDADIDTVFLKYSTVASGAASEVRADIIVSGTRATGTEHTTGFGVENWVDTFVNVPGGSGWTQAQINGITVELIATDIALGASVAVSRAHIELRPAYVPPDTGPPSAKHGPDGAAVVHSISGSSAVHGP